MNKSCRFIVGLSCNYACEYCCNKLPPVQKTWKKINMREAIELILQYQNVCITEGEPTHPSNFLTADYLLRATVATGRRAFVYTNLSSVPYSWIYYVYGWSIGFHPSQEPDTGKFLDRVNELGKAGGRNVRVLAEDCEVHKLEGHLPHGVMLKSWERDKCDKSDIEDLYLICEGT